MTLVECECFHIAELTTAEGLNKFVVHMHILVNIVYSMHSLYLCRYQVFLCHKILIYIFMNLIFHVQ